MKVANTWEGTDQPHDEEVAGNTWFYVSSYREFQDGLKLALEKLKKYKPLVDELELSSSPYEKEMARLQRMIDWGEQKMGKASSHFGDIEVPGITWLSLRYLKSGALLKAQEQFDRRCAAIKKYKIIPSSILEAIDERIEQLQNLSEQGMLNGLRPADIFFEITSDSTTNHEIEDTILQSTITGVSYTRQNSVVVDPILKKRCLDLLRTISDQGDERRLDTIVREMSVVLEDRIRELSGYSGKKSGVQLVNTIMGKSQPLIRFSQDEGVQESAHAIFRGFLGLIRNDVMHKLVKSYTQEHIIQLMGTVDYMLFLLSRAEVTKDRTTLS